MADATYAPVVTRFLTYDVAMDRACTAYCKRMMELPALKEWVAAAHLEPDEVDELDAEF
jgi:glutathione S-transferase